MGKDEHPLVDGGQLIHVKDTSPALYRHVEGSCKLSSALLLCQCSSFSQTLDCICLARHERSSTLRLMFYLQGSITILAPILIRARARRRSDRQMATVSFVGASISSQRLHTNDTFPVAMLETRKFVSSINHTQYVLQAATK